MSRPCTCRACGHKFEGAPCLHEYVAPKCPDCGSEDVDEPGADLVAAAVECLAAYDRNKENDTLPYFERLRAALRATQEQP